MDVTFYEALRRQARIELGKHAVRPSATGTGTLRAAGLLLSGAGQALASRGYLGWTMRRAHFSGSLGVAMIEHLMRRHDGSRAAADPTRPQLAAPARCRARRWNASDQPSTRISPDANPSSACSPMRTRISRSVGKPTAAVIRRT
ncbi:hypothetical protein GCM10028797_18410 [Dyella agri]